MFIRLDRDYEVKCTLGTIKEIVLYGDRRVG